jgi:MOSC domain-containing protein YiiM
MGLDSTPRFLILGKSMMMPDRSIATRPENIRPPERRQPRVAEILTANSPASEMTSRSEARAVPGKGLEGDRYFCGTGTFSPPAPRGDFEITFIEREQIEAFARESGLPFTSRHARRNIVTEGVALNDLAGSEFYVGDVRIRGIRLCEPCHYLAKISFAEALKGLSHKGGLRAQILSEGLIRVGDRIRRCEGAFKEP